MEEILHQLIWRICHYLQGFIYLKWRRIFCINSSHTTLLCESCFLNLSSPLLSECRCLTCFFHQQKPQTSKKTLSSFFCQVELDHLRFLFCFHATFVLLWFRSICAFGTIVGGLQCRVGRTFSAGFGTGAGLMWEFPEPIVFQTEGHGAPYKMAESIRVFLVLFHPTFLVYNST